jgi:hypothetical protein
MLLTSFLFDICSKIQSNASGDLTIKGNASGLLKFLACLQAAITIEYIF